jgi:hypothetical protein
MPMRRVVGWVAAGVLIAGLLAMVSFGTRGAYAEEDASAFSADDLGEPDEHGSILQMLDPEEREALARSQMTGMRPEPSPGAAPKKEATADTVGKVGISIASVALSVAAVVAPFFLF